MSGVFPNIQEPVYCPLELAKAKRYSQRFFSFGQIAILWFFAFFDFLEQVPIDAKNQNGV